MRKKLHYIDYQILLPYLILVIVGCVMVYSASSDLMLLNGIKASTYGIKQLEFDLIALTVGGLFFAVKLSLFKSKKFVIGFLSICILSLFYLLAMKVIKGNAAAVNGAVGWINIGFMSIQPLEFTKLALVCYLAFILNKRTNKIYFGNIWSQLAHPAIIAFGLMVLVVLEPDVGGTAILFMIVLVIFSTSGAPTKIAVGWLLLVFVGVIGIFFLVTSWNPKFLQDSYQYQRLMSFLHPFQLEQKGGAQLVNSYYAIHNGGLFGVGLGNSMQKRGYLPEPYTDFILSIIAEELGTIMAIVLLAFMFYLMWRIMEVGIYASTQFNALVCFGVTTIIFNEAVFNIGAVLGLLPITGVTLPFISYGGSSMLVLTAAVGLVLNISANEKMKAAQEAVVL